MLLVNNIAVNKKQKVLGTKTTDEQKIIKKVNPKKSHPVLSFELANKKYPSLTPSLRPTPSLTPTPSGPEASPGRRPTITPGSSGNQTSADGSVSISEPKASAQVKTINSSINSPFSLIQQINQYRSSKGMATVSENTETCAFASTRANEIISNFNHDGFTNRVNSNSLPYPSYSTVAENIAMNSDSNQVVPGWINSPGHAENLLKDVPYGCVGNSGINYVFEGWKP